MRVRRNAELETGGAEGIMHSLMTASRQSALPSDRRVAANKDAPSKT